tara:strand:+ start:419 stop:811 length:393 start_codon:yes stop_codon:yes gene_type:complete
MKITKEQMIEVHEWDKLVEETYGKPYSFQQQDGCKERGIFRLTIPDEAEDFEQDTVPEIVNHEEMGVSFEAWLERDPKQPLVDGENIEKEEWSIKLWWERNFYPDIQMIANDLYKKSIIEKGSYVIEIDW